MKCSKYTLRFLIVDHEFLVLRVAQGVAQLEDARAWGGKANALGTIEGVPYYDDLDREAPPALGYLNSPHGVVAMSTGAVWVADTDNNRVCLLR